jgi:hypothetical protein
MSVTSAFSDFDIMWRTSRTITSQMKKRDTHRLPYGCGAQLCGIPIRFSPTIFSEAGHRQCRRGVYLQHQSTTMVSIQHVIVLDNVDMHLMVGDQGWKCTAILRITVAADASGMEVQVISD